MIRRNPLRVALAVLLAAAAAAPQSLLHIRVLEGDGAVRRAGARDQRAVVVQVTDEAGNPAAGVTVSFRLPEEGPSGAFERGMKTDIVTTAADGRASMYGVTWNRLTGPFQIRVTAVKSQVRAGTVIPQTTADLPRGGGSGSSAAGSNRKRWIAIATAIGGGAAVGITAGVLGGSRSPASGQAPTAAIPPPQVGPPTLTIGRP